jgi:MinD-like ATPase involved in chromosome partitioning or flagellar assembly
MPVSAEIVEEARLTVPGRDTTAIKEAQARPVDLGPMLAVCGLTGGAGATTLAYLVALAAAEQDDGPVLIADTGGPSGGLATLAGVETPHSLPELASQIAARHPLETGIYATGPTGVRVLASGPDFSSTQDHDQLARLLIDAREAHCLTVIDCGTLAREADRIALGAATHIAWILPATADGIRRGQRVLHAAPRTGARQLVVGRRDVHQTKAPLRDLRHLARELPAPLVLVPHLPELESRRHSRAVDAAQVPVQAILGALQR